MIDLTTLVVLPQKLSVNNPVMLPPYLLAFLTVDRFRRHYYRLIRAGWLDWLPTALNHYSKTLSKYHHSVTMLVNGLNQNHQFRRSRIYNRTKIRYI